MPLGCWEQQFPACEPVAHRLGMAFPNRWVRFHSLPGSKRYPENEAEYATVLNRHNRILAELTGSERDVVLWSTGYSESSNPVRPQSELESLDPKAMPWRSVPMHELEEGFTAPSYWHVFVSVWEWHPGLFDPIIRLVADDVLANIRIVNPACRWLLHPYDGGMDVIAESSETRDRLNRLTLIGFLPDLMACEQLTMNHSTCDGCGRELLTDSEVRYEVSIEVKAAYDPLAISAEDLEKDYQTEIAKVLRQLEGLSTTEAQNQVYRVFDFDLCPACQRRYIRILLSGRFLPS